MEKLKKKVKSKDGYSYPFVAVMVIVFLLFAVAIFEVLRINIVTANVRNKFQSAIIVAVTDNYSAVYPTVREGYAASYNYTGMSWKECNNATKGKIMDTILSDFTNGEDGQVTIGNIDFNVQPSSVAPANKNTSQKFNITGNLEVSIPFSFAWKGLPPIEMNIEVKSEWRMMF